MHGQAVRTLFKADEKMSPEKQQRHRKIALATDSDNLGSRYLLDGEEEDSEVDVDQPDSDRDRWEGQY